jgi:hypothetical protein
VTKLKAVALPLCKHKQCTVLPGAAQCSQRNIDVGTQFELPELLNEWQQTSFADDAQLMSVIENDTATTETTTTSAVDKKESLLLGTRRGSQEDVLAQNSNLLRVRKNDFVFQAVPHIERKNSVN